jgi:hypothetical protein
MAKLDWLFLPVDFDEDEGEEMLRLPVRKLNRLHPQPNLNDLRSKASLQFERTPGNHRYKMKPSLTRRR